MSSKWVGAGDLKPGDALKEADGGTGTVLNVLTVQQTKEMFNLTVDEAHTFYVGQEGWLVHNASGPIIPIPYGYGTDRQLYIEQVAKRYGINLKGSGVSIQLIYDDSINKNAASALTRSAEGGRIIRIGPGAFDTSNSTLREAIVAENIAHELVHAREYLTGVSTIGPSGENRALAQGETLRTYVELKLSGCL